MFIRQLRLPERSFFLFGPRGVGKTTWLHTVLPNAHWVNLLLDRELVQLTRDPALFGQTLAALRPGSWVVVDEVQRLPALLNDVHDHLTRHHEPHLRFALTGSSARRLKRADVNLLAGRVVMRRLMCLCVAELAPDFDCDVDKLLRFGGLPIVRSELTAPGKVDLLEAYVETYLAQEIRAEAIVRSLDAFTRFLEVAALMNAQVANVASVARDAGIARPTVQGYFEVLVDTLIGFWLPAWRPRAKIKEIAHPKFYFFDPGVVRALGRRLREPLESAERGSLLETWVYHELRCFMNTSGCGGELSYWRTPSGAEVDFVWTRGNRSVGIEVKATSRWRSEHARALHEQRTARIVQRAIGVYLGSQPLKDAGVDVLPLMTFLSDLKRGNVIG